MAGHSFWHYAFFFFRVYATILALIWQLTFANLGVLIFCLLCMGYTPVSVMESAFVAFLGIEPGGGVRVLVPNNIVLFIFPPISRSGNSYLQSMLYSIIYVQ